MNTADPFVRALTGDETEQTITVSRVYSAPVADVWHAMTTPERIARWYGTIVGGPPRRAGDRFEVDLGGGVVRRAVLEDCEPPTALVYTWWSGDDDPGLVRIRLDALADAQTRMTVQHDRLRPHRMLQYGAGWESNLVSLAAAVGAPDETDVPVEQRAQRWDLLRSHALRMQLPIAAPVDEVWAAWADGDALASWWWTHWDDVSVEADVRPGGSYRITAPSHGISVSGEYLLVEPGSRLAFTWVWTDDDGSTQDEAVEVRFQATDAGTTVDLRHTGPWGDEAPADSYRQGWDFVLGVLARRLSGESVSRREN